MVSSPRLVVGESFLSICLGNLFFPSEGEKIDMRACTHPHGFSQQLTQMLEPLWKILDICRVVWAGGVSLFSDEFANAKVHKDSELVP